MKTSNRPVISCTNLQLGYKTGTQTKKISAPLQLEAFKGELIAVVGPNGVGKSTLLRTLCGVHPPLEGRVEIAGKDLLAYTHENLATLLSVVLTDKIAVKTLTAKELIALGRQPYTNWLGRLTQEDHMMVHRVMEQLDLLELENTACHEMSDGQLQRVMIARALAQDTELIILDEPTSHLDLYHKASIFNLLKKICKETGKTILFSSHEIELTLQLCHKILVLQNNTTHFGTPESLIADGSFQALFPTDLIKFDPETGAFRFIH